MSQQPQQPTPEQSLALLSEALQPGNITRLNRTDFVNVELALQNVAAALKELADLKAPKDSP